MGSSGPSRDDIASVLKDLSPGMLEARALARRLKRIVSEMGEGISETLYRRASEAARQGNHHLILADSNNDRVLGMLLRQGPPATPSRMTRPDIGLPGNPRQLRDAWENLSSSDRSELFHLDTFLGNRGGIPTADRDFYNRRNLDALLRQAQEANDRPRVENYAGIKAILDEPGLFLTHIDNEGGLAFSRGNPDFSRNNAILLQPAHRPEFVLSYARSITGQLQQVARLVAPNSSTAVSYWGGYNQPESMVQAIFPQPAQDGAAGVRDYHEGLRASHEGGSAHTTTVGHSYGSVLAAESAGRGATLHTDDVVFMGSWGTGADHVGDLRLAGISRENNGDHVFATIASSDFVQLMPDTHGRLPTDPGFGATVFGSTPLIPEHWNQWDHSAEAYLHSDNPASRNIGLIIAGHGSLVA
ncbi:alpha/beta hydrolase [Nocardia testacea]|uniref:Alpha/beta hydrolase n=1 Tax=Nocardia testacea TaxID=248551 RepID=A0ABW7W1V9_9NOCA